MDNVKLYNHSHTGTKKLIEQYIESVKETLSLLVRLCYTEPRSRNHVYGEVLRARRTFGKSVLLLSGGGTFGMNHIGVVKTLWQHKLLPRIICGSSAGSIVSAALCIKIDAEIVGFVDEFCYGDLAVFENEGEETILKKAARFLKHGTILDISNLTRVLQNLLGDVTFKEAYSRTRRILNISVSSAGIHELPQLLNYITAPDVMIWSAVAASCSVPIIFSPASLLAKDPKTGDSIPWYPSQQRWIDGSINNDLPMAQLAEMFHVNHFIVSQVNPHVVPFLAKEGGMISAPNNLCSLFTPGSGWMHKIAGMAKDEALHRMNMLAELGIFPNCLTILRSILGQKYSGDITILPEMSYANFPKVLQNPNADYILQAVLSGERATWLKLSQIQNQCAIELALDNTVEQLRSIIPSSLREANSRHHSLAMFPANREFVGPHRYSQNSIRRRYLRQNGEEPDS